MPSLFLESFGIPAREALLSVEASSTAPRTGAVLCARRHHRIVEDRLRAVRQARQRRKAARAARAAKADAELSKLDALVEQQ